MPETLSELDRIGPRQTPTHLEDNQIIKNPASSGRDFFAIQAAALRLDTLKHKRLALVCGPFLLDATIRDAALRWIFAAFAGLVSGPQQNWTMPRRSFPRSQSYSH